MSPSKPNVVFALAERSWSRWLPPFLSHDAFETRIHWIDSNWQLLADDLGLGTNLLIPFSLHDTLLPTANVIAEFSDTRRRAIIHASKEVAALAHDKRLMAQIAAAIPGCSPIPELYSEEAQQRLADGAVSAVVVKASDTTEGRGLRVCRTVDDFRAANVGPPEYLFQHFVEGLEYSINLVCHGLDCLAFEPICKGPTSCAGIHPCRRLRFCPCPGLDPATRERLVSVATAFARAVGVEGLVEIELILAGEEIYFLEMNPRLSATMRMASLACNRSIFAEVALPWLAPVWPEGSAEPVCFTAELPLPPGTEQGLLTQIGFPVWISSRITTSAPDPDMLARRLSVLASRLGLTRVLADAKWAVA
jgi:predicted ATP-grasp superfamily ATP-dependent carboligase